MAEMQGDIDDIARQKLSGKESNGTNGVTNGVNGASKESSDLKIPDKAVKEGVKAVRKEVEDVCDVVINDE